MTDDRIVRRLNVVIALLALIAVFVAMPYLLLVLERVPQLLLPVIAAAATAVVFVTIRTYRAIRG
ncbi:hypothetical protein [Haladaptatus salinisoli]|uniref:hypothetical protein n=1 Tax=Haladaptatus salinisoli TaxID=2884876 RepID=UPI001D0B8AFE|nr:hypothetical protein [Haladaptatus salinisoli]